jgi:NADH:ubiquinone oxidoreductase subunit E
MPAEAKQVVSGTSGMDGPESTAVENDPKLWEQLKKALDSWSSVPGALIPVLQTAQDLFGYLPEKVIKYVAERLDVPYSEVTGVVTFYSYFSTVPRGKHVVRVCLGTACYVRGGKEVLEAMQKTLGIGVGETTPDRQFSLQVGRCFGACGLAPVVLVDDDVHQRVKPARVRDVIEPYGGDHDA